MPRPGIQANLEFCNVFRCPIKALGRFHWQRRWAQLAQAGGSVLDEESITLFTAPATVPGLPPGRVYFSSFSMRS